MDIIRAYRWKEKRQQNIFNAIAYHWFRLIPTTRSHRSDVGTHSIIGQTPDVNSTPFRWTAAHRPHAFLTSGLCHSMTSPPTSEWCRNDVVTSNDVGKALNYDISPTSLNDIDITRHTDIISTSISNVGPISRCDVGRTSVYDIGQTSVSDGGQTSIFGGVQTPVYDVIRTSATDVKTTICNCLQLSATVGCQCQLDITSRYLTSVVDVILHHQLISDISCWCQLDITSWYLTSVVDVSLTSPAYIGLLLLSIAASVSVGDVCMTTTLTGDINIIYVWPSKTRSRSRSTFFAMTLFDCKY